LLPLLPQEHHTSTGTGYYLAPLYLTMVVMGMVGLVFTPSLNLPCAEEEEEEEERSKREGQLERDLLEAAHLKQDADADHRVDDKEASGMGGLAMGLLAALGTGVMSATQYGAVTAGKEAEVDSLACSLTNSSNPCPEYLQEQFNPTGSWMVSFGLGAAMSTVVYVILLLLHQKLQGRPMPSFEFETMKGPGSMAGLCWCVANFFNTVAVQKGGNAIIMAQTTSVQLVTSGLWGIFYYKEMKGWHAVVWGCFAIWTLASMLLLGLEKAT